MTDVPEPFDTPTASAVPTAPETSAASAMPAASESSEAPTVPAAPDPIRIRSITVRTGRLVVDISIPDERHRQTTPRLAAFVEQSYPDLPHHACVNGRGPDFGSVMECTSTAHMLEHLVISLQTRAATGLVQPFVGTTEWVDEATGQARIEVSFRDDLEALRAFNEATRFLNIAVLTCLS